MGTTAINCIGEAAESQIFENNHKTERPAAAPGGRATAMISRAV
jgi:hypothetical protein